MALSLSLGGRREVGGGVGGDGLVGVTDGVDGRRRRLVFGEKNADDGFLPFANWCRCRRHWQQKQHSHWHHRETLWIVMWAIRSGHWICLKCSS